MAIICPRCLAAPHPACFDASDTGLCPVIWVKNGNGGYSATVQNAESKRAGELQEHDQPHKKGAK